MGFSVKLNERNVDEDRLKEDLRTVVANEGSNAYPHNREDLLDTFGICLSKRSWTS